jgi:hypothetical protein
MMGLGTLVGEFITNWSFVESHRDICGGSFVAHEICARHIASSYLRWLKLTSPEFHLESEASAILPGFMNFFFSFRAMAV